MRIYRLEHVDQSLIEPHLTRTLKPHGSPVLSSAIDQTGTLLATGASDGIVKVWDIERGYTSHTFSGHGGLITALQFFQVDEANEEETSTKSAKSKKRNRNSEPDVNGKVEAAGSNLANGYRLASGDENGQVRVWNLQKRTCVASLSAHGTVVHCLAYEPAQRLLMSGSRDKTVILWDCVTWKPRNTIPTLEVIEAGGFLCDGALVYTGGEAGRLKLFDTRTGNEVTTKQSAGSEEQTIKHLIYHPGLRFILSTHTSQTLVLHSLAPLDAYTPGNTVSPLPVLRQLSGTHDEIIDLAYVGRTRDYLAIATNLEEIRILSLVPTASQASSIPSTPSPYFGADAGSLIGHTGIVICLDVDWSGHWLVTGAKDTSARLWRIDLATSTFTCHSTYIGHAEAIGAVTLPKDAPPSDSPAFLHPLEHPPPFLLTGSQDKTIKRWTVTAPSATPNTAADTSSKRAVWTRKAHDRDINALDLSPDSRLFASGSQDRTAKIFDARTGDAVAVLRGHRRGVWTVRFSPRGTVGVTAEGSGAQAGAGRGYLLTGSGDKTVKLWSLGDYTCLRTFEGHTNSVLKVVWLLPPSASAPTAATTKTPPRIASAGGDGLVKVWDAHSGELASTLDNHTDRVWALAAAPPVSASVSPHALLSGGADGVLTFWADTTTSTLTALSAHTHQRTEQAQALSNAIRRSSYREAIALALQLNHPAQLLAIFAAAARAHPPDPGSLSGSAGVDAAIAQLSDLQLLGLLRRVRDWNASARTAPVAQRVLWTIVRTVPPARFARLRSLGRRSEAADEVGVDGDAATAATANGTGRRAKGGSEAGIGAVMDALAAYTERHYRRAEELLDESYLVEYTLREMDEIAGAANGVDV